jgi:hypothetical protein
MTASSLCATTCRLPSSPYTQTLSGASSGWHAGTHADLLMHAMLLHACRQQHASLTVTNTHVCTAAREPERMFGLAMQILQPGSEHDLQHCLSHGLQHGRGSANRRRENRQADGLDLVTMNHISKSQISQAYCGMQVSLNLQYFACCGGAPLLLHAMSSLHCACDRAICWLHSAGSL